MNPVGSGPGDFHYSPWIVVIQGLAGIPLFSVLKKEKFQRHSNPQHPTRPSPPGKGTADKIHMVIPFWVNLED